MRNEVNYLTEPFLTRYFLLDSICRDFIGDGEREAIKLELSRVFCVPLNDETRELLDIADSEPYKSITDHSAYERLCRTIEFAETSGQHPEVLFLFSRANRC